jgi:hypothetical protein
MEALNNKVQNKLQPSMVNVPDLRSGLFQSITVNKDPGSVYDYLKTAKNIKNISTSLPKTVDNFLDLEFFSSQTLSPNHFEMKWRNSSEAKIQGDMTFRIEPGPLGKSTVISAEANFGKFTSKNEAPSDLINVFLKLIKAYLETGVIASTEGQPSGREEITIEKTIH